jgi:hypothetical protein
MQIRSSDRLNLRVLYGIAILGAVLAVYGWLRYLGIL